uniref:CMRF35-like molecule 8 isoform X2 n=1 Tax=Scatophagus argus TaxID=75038 RepID=UPI001ED80B84|nr:CMRF35-like molecule 8 isoform X2 [Scatophagus argus]
MKIQCTFICFFFLLPLLDGKTFEEKTLRTRTGGSIVVQCTFAHDENRKYFCKDECGEDDVLVQTTGDKKQKGRYSIEYVPGPPPIGSLYVSITQLTESDSGRYRCALDRPFLVDPYQEFTVVVTGDPITPKPDLTVPDLSFPVPSVSTPTTQSVSSESDQQQTAPAAGVWLYVGLTLAVMVILLSLAVLIYCRKRSAKPKDPPVETLYAPVSQDTQVYENIRVDRQSRSPPVEISHAKYDRTQEAETDIDSDSVTSSQNTVEHDSSQLTYSEVNFSSRPVGWYSRSVGGQDDNVVYSVPRT